MRSSVPWFLIAIVSVALSAVSLNAADTGTISGAVFDPNGQPVADATVRISGAAIPAGRSVQTGENGLYQFLYLIPGDYVVESSKAGIGNAGRAAVVEVGKDTQVDLIIGLVIQEQVTVSAAEPIVDVRSAEVGFNFTDETLSSLPLERTYRGLFQLIPGVSDNRSPVGPAAGGSRQDNAYLIDGANITSPAFGYLSTEVNELDISEVNIKRAGISAEFGRTSGTVINAVSRSGSNQFSGVARLDWVPEQLVAGYELPADLRTAGVRPGTFRDPLLTTEVGPAVGLGGPVLHDRVFFYGSARYSRQTKWSRFNKVGTPLPDEVRTGPELFGKLTFVPTARHQVTTSHRSRPNHVENAGINSDFAPTVATSTDNGSRVATAEWAHFMTSSRTLNVRYFYMKENNEDVPIRDLGYQPTFDPRNLAAMGQYVDPSQANLIVGANQYTNFQNYHRHEARATFSQLLDIGRMRHELRAGGGFEFAEETFNRRANGWGIIASLTENGVPVLRTRYYAPQAPQLGQAHTYSLFVQDDMTIGTRTSMNIGLLLNRDEFAQRVNGSGGCPAVLLKGGAAVYESGGDTCKFLQFGFAKEIQPRVGVTYQLRDGGDKAYGQWGRYYNMDQKSSARSLSPRRIFQTQTVFNLAGNILSSGPLANTTGKMIDPDLEPIYTDEILAGYATPLGGRYSIDIFFISRNMKKFIEDVPSRMSGTAPDAGPFVAANLPCSRFASCQSADARRTYRALTFDLRRRLAGGWMSDLSYTWSRFEGNFDLDYATVSVFNTSSFIQDGPGANVEDPNRSGPLFEDRPHVVKLLTSYAMTSRLSGSAYLRLQSGTPWAARGRDLPGAVLNYLEPAGSHRNPMWTNLDLMASYRLPLEGRATLSLEARLLNVFDKQTRLSTDSQQYLDLQRLSTPPFIASYQQHNPFFGTGNGFAPPRRLHLAVLFNF
jgi:hypothetical protein